jgi:sugar/nucleoside kinase (ribokinase family)
LKAAPNQDGQVNVTSYSRDRRTERRHCCHWSQGDEIVAPDCDLTLGSASAIFAAGISKLGHPVTFVSQVGRDGFGDFCINALNKAGVTTDNVVFTDEKTGVTIALSTGRDRALLTYQGAISTFTADRVDRSLLNGQQHLHLTSYYLQQGLQPSFADLLGEAKTEGLTTSFDPNTDPAGEWGGGIHRVIPHTEVLFVNEREASNLTGKASARSALKVLAELVPCAVIKLGRRGAIAMKDNQLFTHAGFKIEVVDTTGAGDSFDAGFMSEYLRGSPVSECLRIGNACGALSALKPGGTKGQPNLRELDYFLRSAEQDSPRPKA